MYNKIILIGRLTRDIELKYTTSGLATAKSSLAVSHYYKDKTTGEQKEEVCFIDFNLFGRSAEVANQYLKKGSKVLIEGRLILNQWVDSTGNKRSKHEIVVETLKFLDKKDEGKREKGEDEVIPNPKKVEAMEKAKSKAQAQHIPQVDINDDEIPF